MAYTPPISGRRPPLATGSTITGATTAVANTYYLVTLAGGLGNVTITLPSAPPQGTEIGFSRTDQASGSTPAITAGSGDSLNETGDGSHYLIGGGMSVTLTYLGTSWYVAASGINALGNATNAPASTANASSLMARDPTGRSQVATPSASSDIANKSYVDGAVASTLAAAPAGSIIMYGGSAAPTGWLLCDGSGVATATYPALFTAIGYNFGGSGSTFNLPAFHDATGRFPRAQTPGATGGSLTHNHTLSSAGQADMAFTGSAAVTRQTAVSGGFTATNQVSVASNSSSTNSSNGLALSGSTDTTSTTPPYVGVTFIIKY